MFGAPKKSLIIYRLLVLFLVFWGSIEDLSTVLAFADITMTLLALVNLIAMALLFKICLRLLQDYDEQRRAGIKAPVFDSSLFLDLDLDPEAWPPRTAGPGTTSNSQPAPTSGVIKPPVKA
jgi:AGCS family alanine or glycine:cation symporter